METKAAARQKYATLRCTIPVNAEDGIDQVRPMTTSPSGTAQTSFVPPSPTKGPLNPFKSVRPLLRSSSLQDSGRPPTPFSNDRAPSPSPLTSKQYSVTDARWATGNALSPTGAGSKSPDGWWVTGSATDLTGPGSRSPKALSVPDITMLLGRVGAATQRGGESGEPGSARKMELGTTRTHLSPTARETSAHPAPFNQSNSPSETRSGSAVELQASSPTSPSSRPQEGGFGRYFVGGGSSSGGNTPTRFSTLMQQLPNLMAAASIRQGGADVSTGGANKEGSKTRRVRRFGVPSNSSTPPGSLSPTSPCGTPSSAGTSSHRLSLSSSQALPLGGTTSAALAASNNVASKSSALERIKARVDLGLTDTSDTTRLEMVSYNRLQAAAFEHVGPMVLHGAKRLEIIRDLQDTLVSRLPNYCEVLSMVRQEYDTAVDLAQGGGRDMETGETAFDLRLCTEEYEQLLPMHAHVARELEEVRTRMMADHREHCDRARAQEKEMAAVRNDLAQSFSNLHHLLQMLRSAQEDHFDIGAISVQKAFDRLSDLEAKQRANHERLEAAAGYSKKESPTSRALRGPFENYLATPREGAPLSDPPPFKRLSLSRPARVPALKLVLVGSKKAEEDYFSM
eukprot:jgi/Mesvir1/10633/Mv09271-RA.1